MSKALGSVGLVFTIYGLFHSAISTNLGEALNGMARAFVGAFSLTLALFRVAVDQVLHIQTLELQVKALNAHLNDKIQ